MLDLTDAARSAIRVAVETSEAARGLRIVCAAGGCAGIQYRLGLAAGADAEDAVQVFDDNVTVYVDPDSARLLVGATVDFVQDERGAGFVFRNPNAASGCAGCSSKGSC
ncbi:HesB/IscA family protein [Roseospira navarrensis]|uniref:Iron-sulfur cluster assembly accessory protein n=1 Tax=Roseospira navarrensis TaxID=140058 RepID=A0A7X1ZHF1_9PROT|nr:iron-sulfur cluster assembly accessory protein [Roseospira navarrensis]MQX38313.1 iron-sulfur cluster assembly accessory protein [Roseospira navarrensis]